MEGMILVLHRARRTCSDSKFMIILFSLMNISCFNCAIKIINTSRLGLEDHSRDSLFGSNDVRREKKKKLVLLCEKEYPNDFFFLTVRCK